MAGNPAWAKGKSGNPSGRPAEKAFNRRFQSQCREHCDEALAVLLRLMRGDDGRLALQAAQHLLDRGFGKPVQAVEGSSDAPVLVRVVTGIERGDGADET